MKKIMKLIIVAFVLVFAGIVALGIDIYRFGKAAAPQKSDCIIVLGCQVKGTVPSPFLQARLDKAIELYREGYGKYIIASGGKGPGENITEAEAMKEYLEEKGVKASSIILEDKSKSTLDNIKNSKEKMEENNLKTAIVVSNKYHLKRASIMAHNDGLEASYSGVFLSNYKFYEISGFLREIPAIIKYYTLG